MKYSDSLWNVPATVILSKLAQKIASKWRLMYLLSAAGGHLCRPCFVVSPLSQTTRQSPASHATTPETLQEPADSRIQNVGGRHSGHERGEFSAGYGRWAFSKAFRYCARWIHFGFCSNTHSLLKNVRPLATKFTSFPAGITAVWIPRFFEEARNV